MDALAVSIANGTTAKHPRVNNALRTGIAFGSFQAFMPVIGWAAGLGFRDLIQGFDHWTAFTLLSLVGGRMIFEATRMNQHEKRIRNVSLAALLMLSVATSIDALAVGLSFSFLNVSIALPILVIGAVTFLLSFVGVLFGNRLGRFFQSKIEVIGGIVLIAIGLKILLEHML